MGAFNAPPPPASRGLMHRNRRKGWNTVFAQLLEVGAGAYSKALSGGRNNCTMREEISAAQTDA